MKYIRTKDHLEELYIDEFTEYGKEYYKNCKIADTIEELCDEKVGTFKDGSKPYIYKQTSWSDLAKDWTQYHNNVYGAIWTDKGLKYVAKMNEKGELELL